MAKEEAAANIKDQALVYLFNNTHKVLIRQGDTVVLMRDDETQSVIVLRPVTVNGMRYKAAFDEVTATLYVRPLTMHEGDPEQEPLIVPE